LFLRQALRGRGHIKAKVFLAAIYIDGAELVYIAFEILRDEASFAKKSRGRKLKNPHVDSGIKNLY
jgi:hypothetical protein